MRISKLIATKNHFLIALKTAEINDEISRSPFVASGVPQVAANTIGYVVTGNTRNYTSNASHGKVKAFDLASPMGAVRPNTKSSGEVVNFQFGVVNLNSGNTVSILVYPRDTKPSTVREHLDSNATTEELNTIDNNQTQTVVISEQCSLTTKIDLNTFEEIEPTVENTVTTEELNIDWG